MLMLSNFVVGLCVIDMCLLLFSSNKLIKIINALLLTLSCVCLVILNFIYLNEIKISWIICSLLWIFNYYLRYISYKKEKDMINEKE